MQLRSVLLRSTLWIGPNTWRRYRLHHLAVICLVALSTLRLPSQTSPSSVEPGPKASGLTLQAAAQALLAGNPQLLVAQSQVDAAEGLRMQASSIFNPQISSQLAQSWASQPLTPYQAAADVTEGFGGTLERSAELLFTGDANKLLRNGIDIDAHFQLERLLDNVVSRGGDNVSALSVGGTLPLLRNRGRQVVDARENAAREEVAATRNDAAQESSQLIATMANSYWALVASQKNLVISDASEQRAEVYRSNVQTLVDADQAPRGDLSQVEANLATRIAQRIAAQQSVIAAEQQLALNIGFSLSDLAKLSLHAQDDFPPAPSADTLKVLMASPDATLVAAMASREDFLAAQKRVEEQQKLLVMARNGLRPRLDLSGSAGFSGLQNGRKFVNFIDASTAGVRGPNAEAQLTYTFPLGNEFAKGQLLQTQTAVRQAGLTVEQLRHEISAQIHTAQSALLHAAQQLAQTGRAVNAAQAALDGEREKYRVGMGSIVDLVTVEDRLTSALGDQVQAQEGFALAIVQLRFATGTFVEHSGSTPTLVQDSFVAIPQNR